MKRGSDSISSHLSCITQRLLIAVAVSLLAFHAGAATAPKPNIIVFLVDDMGWQDTSVPFYYSNGMPVVTPFNKKFHTPNMERLASEGMKFTSAYACSVCTPTRVSLMTGLNAARHKVTNWTLRKDTPTDGKHPRLQPPEWNVNGFSPDPVTPRAVCAPALPQLLRDFGYRTIHAGKAHWGALNTPGADPKNLGFDVNIAGHAAGAPGSYLGEQNYTHVKGEHVWDVPGLEKYHGTETFLTEALTIEANKAVEESVREQKPFFLYMAHYAVHVQHLERLGVASNTVVLFMSDNGGLSAHGRSGAPHTHNAPLSSGKGSAREGGIREPMIVRWPGVAKPGSICAQPVIIEDFFPSILEMAGMKTLPQADGRSFVPLLRGDTGGRAVEERSLFWHYPNVWGPTGPGIEPYSAIRRGDWKLIFYHAGPHFELFNLAEDIGENKNLMESHKDKAKDLTSAVAGWLKETGAQLPIEKATGKSVRL